MTSTHEQREKRRIRRLANLEQYKATAKAWRNKNKEKVHAKNAKHWAKYKAKYIEVNREKSKRHYEANKARYKARNAAWKTDNPEKMRNYVAKWKSKDPEHARALERSRYHKNLEASREKSRRSVKKARLKNPQYFIEAAKKRHAIKKGAEVGNIKLIADWVLSWKSKAMVTCYWCKSKIHPSKAVKDHIIPLSNLGPHCVENLCISCRPCNGSKNALPLERWNTRLQEPVLL